MMMMIYQKLPIVCYIVFGIDSVDPQLVTNQTSRSCIIASLNMAEGNTGIEQLAQGCTCKPRNNPSRGL